MTWELGHQGPGIWVRRLALAAMIFSLPGIVSNTQPVSAEKIPASASVPARDKIHELPDLIFVQATIVESYAAKSRFPEGSRLVRLPGKTNSKEVVNLTAELFAASDPQVSFDGERVVFSGQKLVTEPWQIWEMRIDGTEKRQITNCAEDCFRPAYLPDDEIVFTVAGAPGTSRSSYLAVTKRDGSYRHRITFGPGNWRMETVLRDGRVVASAASPLIEGTSDLHARFFYTLRPDGTALESLRCEHKEMATRNEASELEDGSVIYAKSVKDGQYGGLLTEIQQGDLKETVVGSRIETFSSPLALSADWLVVARKTRTAGKAEEKFDLYAFDMKRKVLGQKIHGDAAINSIQAVPIVKRVIPKKFWSMVNNELKSGYLISLNSYASVDEANGRIGRPITNVRVWTLQPSTQNEVVLGEAPVEKDGSFYVEVPADQPVRFELLDASGQSIRVEHGWIWSRAGEQRGCAGCHGDKAVAPENRWPMTLKRFDTPTQFGERQGMTAGTHAN
jgi:Hydrazine synthase alpha subunit middle domain